MDTNINKHLESLTEIRSLMERSQKFISLNGLSGIFAGFYALIGAGTVFIADRYYNQFPRSLSKFIISVDSNFLWFCIIDALLVLTLSVATAIFLSNRKAIKTNQSLFDKSAQRLLINLCIPLFAGGVFSIALLLQLNFRLVAPTMLIFYGLSLINASKYTFGDIRYLGLVELGLGLINLFVLGYGFWFWCIGFGVMHIIYGLLMYKKYDSQPNN